MKGRKPNPRHLRVVNGNAGKRPLPEDGFRLSSERADAPEHLDDTAQDAWNRLMPELVGVGSFTSLDHDALAQYCQVYSRWRRAEDALKSAEEDTYETHGKQGKMLRARPEVAIIAECIRLMRSIGSEFGFSPVARLRLKDIGQGDMFNAFDVMDRKAR
ncbi:phage terminase small subunit P27 family [Gluconobacter cerinus]|uniref:phage terminase small subunit P27 family n=1 Tax=Gluconobacter cerinus TaxID=38307 RepID=UPI001B8B0A38|nr:phage terminase small subunit P27 family [Gluconobacter cerinus]MBS1026053.1 phage terminase small subunit P27 family [Gluconobacter cerinus]